MRLIFGKDTGRCIEVTLQLVVEIVDAGILILCLINNEDMNVSETNLGLPLCQSYLLQAVDGTRP
jgi:hypothetical protein